MRHLFLINPHAGKYDRTQEMREKLRTALAGRDEPWEAAVVTQYPATGPSWPGRRRRGGAGAHYACGGDGTLNEACCRSRRLRQRRCDPLPHGFGQRFSADVRPGCLPLLRPPGLLDAPQAPVDLIECNGRLALNVCSVGFDARIGLGAADFKKLPLVSGPLAYQLSAVRTIVQGIHRPYRVTIDGERLPGEAFTLICACNGRYYGGGFNPCPDAVPDDGLLDFVVVPAVSRLTILTLIGKYAKGGAGDIPRILLRRGREMHVACERADRINLDGEELVDSELSVRVSAKKVNFFFPEGTHWIPEKRVRN
ncbi:MAG: diacylglycerol/lipid kinase family protein [Flavonifractor plautii]